MGDTFLQQIGEALAKNPKVKLAFALGSVISGRAGPESDFDLAVVVDNSQIGYKEVYDLLLPMKLHG